MNNMISANKIARFEPLRPLIRSALMKDEISEQDRTILIRKAVSLGMDAEEFTLLLNSLIVSKKNAGKKSLFRRKPNYDEYFDLDFDNDFDENFLSAEERLQMEQTDWNDMMKMVEDIATTSQVISRISKTFE